MKKKTQDFGTSKRLGPEGTRAPPLCGFSLLTNAHKTFFSSLSLSLSFRRQPVACESRAPKPSSSTCFCDKKWTRAQSAVPRNPLSPSVGERDERMYSTLADWPTRTRLCAARPSTCRPRRCSRAGAGARRTSGRWAASCSSCEEIRRATTKIICIHQEKEQRMQK